MARAAPLRPLRRSVRGGARRSDDRLPPGLARLFWDYPPGTLRLGRDGDLIVRRVASEGGLRVIRLLRSRVADEAIREVILRTGARGLSPQRVRSRRWPREGRGRTFVDVFALAQRFTLDEMLELYPRRFGVRDVGHTLVALSYFDDADRERMPTMLRPWNWPAIKSAIRTWVARAASG